MDATPAGDRAVCENLTDDVVAAHIARGYALAFAEDVMRFDTHHLSADVDAPLPAGVALATWDESTTSDFFAAYVASFRERPGFPGWSRERWVDWTANDDGFRPDLTWVALAGVEPVGFITCGADTAAETPTGYIIQVGVRPDWRGRGLARALMVRALAGWRDAGYPAVILDVNVNNPGARRLYERLGFTIIRRRGVFERQG